MTPKDEIIRLLIDRAPNLVNETLIRTQLSKYDEATVTEALRALIQANQIVEQTDRREKIGRPLRYYRLSSLAGIPIREKIKVGDIEVPRLLCAYEVEFFPEDFNETVERLAVYSAGLERRFADLVKEEQRKYWANIISVFGVFVAILAFVLVGMPKITTDPSLSFWNVVLFNLAQVLPLAGVLVLFIVVLRLVIR